MPIEAVAIVVLVLAVLTGAIGALVAVLWRLLGIVERALPIGEPYRKHELLRDFFEGIGTPEDGGALGPDERSDTDRY